MKDKTLIYLNYVCSDYTCVPRELKLLAHINHIKATNIGETQKLKIGNDTFWELNFCENGNTNRSDIKVYWSSEVKVK